MFLNEAIFLFASSLLTQSRTKRAQAAQELRDREEVEKELSVVKAWIQETRELLLNPTPDIDSLLQELEVYLLLLCFCYLRMSLSHLQRRLEDISD